jgi:hypothetical protein
MPESPGAEFVPLEPPLTPRTPREEAGRAAKSPPPGAVGQRRLSPHFELAAGADAQSPTRLTPGPAREWIFRDDEVSTDTRSSTTELASEVLESVSSQDDEGEGHAGGGARAALRPRLKAANAAPAGAQGASAQVSPRGKSPRVSAGSAGLQLRGIEVAARVVYVCTCV